MIKVFIIDDSILMRNSIKKLLKQDSDISVLGEAPNPIDALEEFKKVGLPDVFILDIEMPKMDGLSFLQKLKEQKQVPTIIFSSVAGTNSENAIKALEFGACDVVLKPTELGGFFEKEFSSEFLRKIKTAAISKSIDSSKITISKIDPNKKRSSKVIAIGASTGGVQTLELIFKNLHSNHPPMLVVQHMPVGFTNSFAKRLNNICINSTCIEAKGGEKLQNGTIYIAPGNLHLEIEKTENGYFTALKDYPKVSGHKPSVDVLFKSLSRELKSKGVAFILTGMGKDGALGLAKIKEMGGKTYGQDEESSIVYGMPKVAYDLGSVQRQVNIEQTITLINEME
jgi:two-component system, chemotaxis family, protein-glutamate methylesterase/glutaminase